MDVNHFGSSTALLSKQFLQTIYVSIHLYIFTRSQDLPRPSPSPHPQREEATDWSNSDIRTLNKIFKVYLWYPKIFQAIVTQEIILSTHYSLILTNCFSCLFCLTIDCITFVFTRDLSSYQVKVGSNYIWLTVAHNECQCTTSPFAIDFITVSIINNKPDVQTLRQFTDLS